jgi:ligand-binding SRPBCC domain-containing protein
MPFVATANWIRTTTELAAPRDAVFAFFSAPENLAVLTPTSLGFDIVSDAVEMTRGAIIDYRIRLARVPLRWRTMIEQWAPGLGFVDSQLAGPYHSWWHEHSFVERRHSTVMEDTVYFSPPLGSIGRLIVEDQLRRIFAYRRGMMRARFDLIGGAGGRMAAGESAR